MSSAAKKTELVPVVLVLDWWDLDDVRRRAGETVKVSPANATTLLNLGIALEGEKEK